MKLLVLLSLPVFLLACSDLTPDNDETAPTPEAEAPAPEEVVEEAPVDVIDDGLSFAEPDTTGNLMTEDTIKSVNGPVDINVPKPTQDSSINVAPSVPSAED